MQGARRASHGRDLLPIEIRGRDWYDGYQLEIQRDCLSILARDARGRSRGPHAYLRSPTGTGKTDMMIMVGERMNADRAARGETRKLNVVIVGREQLVRQHRETIDGLAAAGMCRSGDWKVMTWQSYREHLRRGRLADAEAHGLDPRLAAPGLVCSDECHLGGSDPEAKSISTIRDGLPGVPWLNVSATIEDVNEDVLGVQDGHVAGLSWADAFARGILHPVDLIRVDIGHELTLKVRSDVESGRLDFARLTSGTPEEQLAELKERYGDEEGRIAAKHIDRFVKYRIDAMVDLHLAKSAPDDRVLMFVPNVGYSEYARAVFDRRFSALHGGPVRGRAAAITYKSEEGRVREGSLDSNVELIGRFKRGGEDSPRMVVAVHQLREGFDMPALGRILDCSFNPKNLRVMIQKIGRLARVERDGDGRPVESPAAEYFYAVDSRALIGKEGTFADLDGVFHGVLSGTAAPSGRLRDLQAAGNADQGILEEWLGGVADAPSLRPKTRIEEVPRKGGGASIALARTRMFYVVHADERRIAAGRRVSEYVSRPASVAERAEQNIDLLVRWLEEHPGAGSPGALETMRRGNAEEVFYVGRFAVALRAKQDRLSESQTARLSGAGFEFGYPKRESIERRVCLLIEWLGENPRRSAPFLSTVVKDANSGEEIALGMFVAGIKGGSIRLDAEQRDRLMASGFRFENSSEAAAEIRLRLLEDWLAANPGKFMGTETVVENPTTGEDFGIGKFAMRVRLGHVKLSEPQRERLVSLGLKFENAFSMGVESNVRLLEEWLRANPGSGSPARSVVVQDDSRGISVSIGDFASYLRSDRGKISESQKKRLLEAGFEFSNPKSVRTERNVVLMEEWLRNHPPGSIPPQSLVVHDSESGRDVTLGVFASRVRSGAARLSEAQLNRLGAAGFVFGNAKSVEFDRRVCLLADWHKRNPGAPHPPISLVVEDAGTGQSIHLGQFSSNLRHKEGAGLTNSQRDLLFAAGFSFSRAARKDADDRGSAR